MNDKIADCIYFLLLLLFKKSIGGYIVLYLERTCSCMLTVLLYLSVCESVCFLVISESKLLKMRSKHLMKCSVKMTVHCSIYYT